MWKSGETYWFCTAVLRPVAAAAHRVQVASNSTSTSGSAPAAVRDNNVGDRAPYNMFRNSLPFSLHYSECFEGAGARDLVFSGQRSESRTL